MPSDYTERLYATMWRTRGARFNAYRRLRRQHTLSLSAIACLSADVILLSVWDLATAQPLLGSPQLTGLVTTGLSLFILVLSLLEAGNDYKGVAEQLHQCGKAISVLYDGLQVVRGDESTDPRGRAAEIGHEYARLIEQYNVNHEPLDDAVFRATNAKDFGLGRSAVFKVHLRALMLPAVYWLVIAAPPISLIYVALQRHGVAK